MLAVVKEGKRASGRDTEGKRATTKTNPKSPAISREKALLCKRLHDAQHAFALLQEACHECNEVDKTTLVAVQADNSTSPNMSLIRLIGFGYCRHCSNFSVLGFAVNGGCEECRNGN